MRFLYLSDIHYDREKQSDWEILSDALKETICQEKESKKFDSLLISGDLINKGKGGYETTNKAFEGVWENVLSPIKKCLEIDNDYIYIAPGNHDMDRNQDDSLSEKMMYKALDDDESVTTRIKKVFDGNYDGLRRVLPYREFIEQLNAKTAIESTVFYDIYVHEINDEKIAFCCINTSWRCYDSKNDSGRLLIGRENFRRIRSKIKDCTLKIAIMHHEFSFLCKFDREKIENDFNRLFDIIICGHVHEVSHESYLKMNSSTIVITGGQVNTISMEIDSIRYGNSISIIDLDKDTEGYSVTVKTFMYDERNNRFVPNTFIGDLGVWTSRISPNRNSFKNSSVPNVGKENFEDRKENVLDLERVSDANYSFSTKDVNISYSLDSAVFYKYIESIREIVNDYCKGSTLVKVQEIDYWISLIDKIVRKQKLENSAIKLTDELFGNPDRVINNEFMRQWVAFLEKLIVKNKNCYQGESITLEDILLALRKDIDEKNKVDGQLLESIIELLNYIRQENQRALNEIGEVVKRCRLILPILYVTCMNVRKDFFFSDELKEPIRGKTPNYLENYVDEITQILSQNNHVILSGKKGIGKTDLAVESFEKLKNDIAVTVLFECSSFSDSLDLIKGFVKECNDVLIKKIAYSKLEDLDDLEKVYIELLEKCIDQLKKEYKNVYLIMNNYQVVEEKLSDIFEVACKELKVIYVTQALKEVNSRAIDNIHIEKITLENVMLLSGIEDEWTNKQIHKIFDGDLYSIKEFVQKLENRKIDTIKKNLEHARNDKNIELRKKADKWIDIEYPFLEEVLLLLAVFQDISALSIEQIQDFLISINRTERLPRIAIQIRGRDEYLYKNEKGAIKINDNNFAQYVCDSYFSKRDFEDFINQVLEWLIASEESRIMALLISKLNGVSNRHEEMLIRRNQSFIDEVKEKCIGKILFRIGMTIYDEFTSQKEMALSFLEQAALKDTVNAMEFLGYYYLHEEKKLIKAKEYLEKAIELNSYKASYFYALAILNREFMDVNDVNMAMQLLEKVHIESENLFLKEHSELASIQYNLEHDSKYYEQKDSIIRLINLAETNENAMYILGKYTIKGIFVDKDIDKGITLLEKAIERGQIMAGRFLALIYIYGVEGVTRNAKKGVEILNSLEDTSDCMIRLTLIKAYFGGFVDTYIEEKAIEELNELIEKDNEEAKFIYAEQAFHNKNRNFDKSYAIELLNKLVDSKEALCQLGDYYSNVKEYDLAIEYYEKAIALGAISAKVDLADIYLNAKSGKYNERKGVDLLKEASIESYPYGRNRLAEYYLKKDNVADQKRGIELLQGIIHKGNAKTERMLGTILIDPRYKCLDVVKGEKLLNQSFNRGNMNALFTLVQEYLYGKRIKKDVEKAEQLLQFAVDRKDETAEALLGKYIVEGRFVHRERIEGLYILEAAVEKNNLLAKMFLGRMKIEGYFVEQNKKEGEEMLFEAADEIPEALYHLADYKLSGNYLDKNTEEGLRLLEKAYHEEDSEAALSLATRLLDGDGVEKNVNRALNIFHDLMNKDNESAIIEYAIRQIKGECIALDIESGKKKLLELMENDSRVARRVYILYMMEGKFGDDARNRSCIEKIEKLANENIEKGDYRTAYHVGRHYVTGKNVPINIEKGISYLEKGVVANDIPCMRYLGMMLLEGDLITRDKCRAVSMLKKCIEEGDVEAKYIYAKCNIEKYVLHEQEKGWKYMEQLASDGFIEAKKYLATACIKSLYRERDIQKGIEIFEQLSNEDEACAEMYAELLLSGRYIDKNEHKAFNLLGNNIKEGYTHSHYIKAKYLIKGNKKEKNKAIKIYEKIMNHNPIAKFELALRYKQGIGVKKNVKKGKELIEQVLKEVEKYHAPLERKQLFALIAYEFNDLELASELFEQSYLSSTREVMNSMAYLIRRKEFTGNASDYPSVHELLSTELEANSYIAKINYALSICIDSNDQEKWKEADKIINSLEGYDDCVEWWIDLLDKGDDEGKLVLAWLLRHNKLWNMNKLNQRELLDSINNKEKIPGWLYEVCED